MAQDVTSHDGFRISYLDRAPTMLDRLLINPERLGNQETAICFPDETKMFGQRTLILWGDHRKKLNEIAKSDGLPGCIKYFLDHEDERHDTSDTVA